MITAKKYPEAKYWFSFDTMVLFNNVVFSTIPFSHQPGFSLLLSSSSPFQYFPPILVTFICTQKHSLTLTKTPMHMHSHTNAHAHTHTIPFTTCYLVLARPYTHPQLAQTTHTFALIILTYLIHTLQAHTLTHYPFSSHSHPFTHARIFHIFPVRD